MTANTEKTNCTHAGIFKSHWERYPLFFPLNSGDETDTDRRYYVILDSGDVTATVRLRNKTLKRLRKLAGNGEGLDEVITRLLSVKPRD